ncbi:phosphatases II [Phellopilus nigrolimitatus]|nr:phosphatases II [Phellopilus nigrolimitatus]
MIRREDMSPEAWASMCVPINEVIPAEAHAGSGALFIGSWVASVDQELLDAHRIQQIVAIHDGTLTGIPSSGKRSEYRVLVADSVREDLKPYLEGVCRHIASRLEHGENVLVYCQQGISRSSSIVIAYLMREKEMGYDDALKVVRDKRPCTKPNVGFEKTLREWEREIKQRVRNSK